MRKTVVEGCLVRDKTMRKTVVAGAILAVSVVTGLVRAQCCPPVVTGLVRAQCCPPKEGGCCSAQPDAAETVDTILKKLEEKATELTSYRCKLDYVFRQPLLESQTRQKGTLQYAKFDDAAIRKIRRAVLSADRLSHDATG